MGISKLAGNRVVVWGAGLEAQGVVRRLLSVGASAVSVAVDVTGKRGMSDVDACEKLGVPVYVEAAARSQILGAECVIVSPSIPPSNPLWRELSALEIPWETTSDLWFQEFGDRTLAVTGSKGKSTTTSIAAAVLEGFGLKVAVGGNIGVAFHDLPEDAEFYVAEVGSNQSARLKHSPRGVVFTSLFPEHLDWHGDYGSYVAAKSRLVEYGADFLVTVPSVLEQLGDMPSSLRVIEVPEQVGQRTDGSIVVDSELWPLPPALRVAHNRRNAALAIRGAEVLSGRRSEIGAIQKVQSFQTLSHRMEVVSESRGLTWIDDSLATSPHPTAAALACYGDRPVVLIVGGLDRSVDYGPLADAIVGRSAETHILTIAENGPAIGRLLRSRQPSASITDCGSIETAVRIAAGKGLGEGVVLFSPAAPSGADHTDYRARSEAYILAIESCE